MRVLVTRPEPGASRTAVKLRAMGFEPVLLPLSETKPLAIPRDPIPESAVAVAITSANAIRHAPEESEVTVESRAADRGVELRVRDRGAGVAPERRAQIFERFATSGGTRTNRGLGLAFCKLVVEAHGGRMWIEDAAPGAAFCLWIPDAV